MQLSPARVGGAWTLVALALGALASCAPAAPIAVRAVLWPASASDSIGRVTTFYALILYSDGSLACATAAKPASSPATHWPAGCDSAAALLDSQRARSALQLSPVTEAAP